MMALGSCGIGRIGHDPGRALAVEGTASNKTVVNQT